MCDQTVTMIPQIRGGTVKPLAVMSRARIAQLPDAAHARRRRAADVEVEAWNALFAPKGTPRELTDKLFELVSDALNAPATRARFEELGAVIPPKDQSGPEALRNHVAAEVRKWVPVLRNAGVSAD